MTKKEIYNLAVTIAQNACRGVFETNTGFNKDYWQKPKGRQIVKNTYDKLEPLLLTEEPLQTTNS